MKKMEKTEETQVTQGDKMYSLNLNVNEELWSRLTKLQQTVGISKRKFVRLAVEKLVGNAQGDGVD